mmetsp:Transcript_12948/g.20513  ORF Transcript_12948/g.20513 Transcript_12948/m.20513 type:complete len:114 (-) Transcript_12948:111-452(-)|eukprot:685840-Amorphochlora_amoeboformis.AAC.2
MGLDGDDMDTTQEGTNVVDDDVVIVGIDEMDEMHPQDVLRGILEVILLRVREDLQEPKDLEHGGEYPSCILCLQTLTTARARAAGILFRILHFQTVIIARRSNLTATATSTST